jgi:hypothetical protein
MQSAAMPERKLAICQGESEQALIAAPPVENRKAARKSSSRSLALSRSNDLFPNQYPDTPDRPVSRVD